MVNAILLKLVFGAEILLKFSAKCSRHSEKILWYNGYDL